MTRKRSPDGTAETTLLLRLPAALARMAKAAAEVQDCTVSEWWRVAARERLRQMARETEPGASQPPPNGGA